MTIIEDPDTSRGILPLADEQIRRATQGWLIGQRSQHTRLAYTRCLKHWMAWCRDHGVDPVNPERQQVQAWCTWMAQVKGYKPASVRQYHAAVKSWHAELGAEGLRTGPDVHARLKLPTASAISETRLLADIEVRGLIVASRRLYTPAETAITMMATMGLRAGVTSTVHAGMIEASPWGPVIRLTQKGGHRMLMPIPPVVLSAANRVRWPGWEIAAGRPNLNDAAYDRMVRWCRQAAKLAAIDDFHPHMLRHWWITRALQLGCEERHVQAGAGHASFNTTQRYNRAVDDIEHHPTFKVAPMVADWLR